MRRVRLLALGLVIALLVSCQQYDTYHVVSSFHIWAEHLDPATGKITSLSDLGSVTPLPGSDYLIWGKSSTASSATDGVALLEFWSMQLDTTDGSYEKADTTLLQVAIQVGDSATADAEGLQDVVASGDHVVQQGIPPWQKLGAKGHWVSLDPSEGDSLTTWPQWPVASTWVSGTKRGTLGFYSAGKANSVMFLSDGVVTDVAGFDSLAASQAWYEGGSSFLAPFYSFALDSTSGKTLRQVTLARIDGAASSMTPIWHFPFSAHPDDVNIVDVSTKGLIWIKNSTLISLGSDGKELGRAVLSADEAVGIVAPGPAPGSGVVIAPAGLSIDYTDLIPTGNAGVVTHFDKKAARSWTTQLANSSAHVVAVVRTNATLAIIEVEPVALAEVQVAVYPFWR